MVVRISRNRSRPYSFFQCLSELKNMGHNPVHGLLSAEVSTGLSKLIRCEDFSSLSCLLSVTTLVIKFC